MPVPLDRSSTITDAAAYDGVPRRRARLACKVCHSHKVRCSADKPSCRRCSSKGLRCEYLPNRRHPGSDVERSTRADAMTPNGAAGPIEDDSQQLPDMDNEASTDPANHPVAPEVHHETPGRLSPRCGDPSDFYLNPEILRQCVDAFFQHVWPVAPFDFIHKGSCMRVWHHGKLSQAILRTLAALGARFVTSESTFHLGLQAQRWISRVEKNITSDLETISLPKLQIILLLIYDRLASGKHATVWQLTAMAVRIAHGLRLNHPTDMVPWVNQECRRRLMWCTYVLEKATAHAGLGYPSLCSRDSIHIQLPCNSQLFELETECHTATINDLDMGNTSTNIGVGGWLVRILDIKDSIKQYASALCAPVPPWDGTSAFQTQKKKLTAFAEALPLDLRDTERALFIRINTPECNTWIMIHTYLYMCHIDLITGVLYETNVTSTPENGQTSSDFTSRCKTELKRVVFRLGQLWRNVKIRSGKHVFSEWCLGPNILDHSKILLNWTSKNLEPDISEEDITMMLQSNLGILTEMASLSPFCRALVSNMSLEYFSSSLTLGATQPVKRIWKACWRLRYGSSSGKSSRDRVS